MNKKNIYGKKIYIMYISYLLKEKVLMVMII